MIDFLLASVRRHWEELGLKVRPPAEYRCFLQSRRRVIVFLFDARNCRVPVAIAKISRDRRQNNALEDSVRKLQAVRRQLANSDLLLTLPRVALLDPVSGCSAAMESCVPGNPMSLSAGPLTRLTAHQRNFAAWRDWLLQFQLRHIPRF